MTSTFCLIFCTLIAPSISELEQSLVQVIETMKAKGDDEKVSLYLNSPLEYGNISPVFAVYSNKKGCSIHLSKKSWDKWSIFTGSLDANADNSEAIKALAQFSMAHEYAHCKQKGGVQSLTGYESEGVSKHSYTEYSADLFGLDYVREHSPAQFDTVLQMVKKARKRFSMSGYSGYDHLLK